ncbi:uncharacterized protein K02A2.6-like [Mya arenaria]|uniref:uncharacterized protein K02A2.6-like n=1 Tax=Mya arenaria TaxID=6604 RepID=UPI0022E1C63E|nr:uncharacterized protein K02A2.6-like [Mya arenaria]
MANSGLIGTLNALNSDSESWISYEERLEMYFVVNSIGDEKKVAALLTLLGEKTYALLRNLTSPQKPAEKTYQELCQLLKTQLCPKPLVIAERFRFHKRNQATGESICDFTAAIRKLAEQCEFNDNLENTLRDRFVCGLQDEATQRKLLSTADLSLKKAIEIATAIETACKDAAELHYTASGSSNVNKIGKKPPSKRQYCKNVTLKPQQKGKYSNTRCIHCGKSNHQSDKCRLKNAICHSRSEKGHIKTVCPNPRNVNVIDETKNESVYVINKVTSERTSRILLYPVINEKQVEMELDTGSAVTIISEQNIKQLFGNIKLDKPYCKLHSYSGETIQQVGSTVVRVDYNNQTKDLRLCVVKGNTPSLFRRDWLSEINVDWTSVMRVNNIESQKNRFANMMNRYEFVFSDGIGHAKGFSAKLTLKDDATPKFMKARSVPFSMKPKIEKELDNLERQGIITKVNTSEWATPIVPVLKSTGDVRICGDFKVTANQALKVDKYPLSRVDDIFANL